MQQTVVASIHQAMTGFIDANAAINNAQRKDRNNNRFDVAQDDGSDEDNPFGDEDDRVPNQGQQHARHHDDNTCGSYGIKIDLPEYHGGPQPEYLLDLFVVVDENLDFTNVSDNKRVSVVLIHFRGHAASWWRQFKLNRS